MVTLSVVGADVGAGRDGAHRGRRLQVLGVDGPRAHGQRLPHRAEGALAGGEAHVGAPPAGGHTGQRCSGEAM